MGNLNNLNLESFDENKRNLNQNKEDECKEYKEKIEFLQNQIKDLKEEQQKQLQEKISEVKNEIYQQLYEDFQKKLEENTKQIESQLIEKYEQEYKQKLEEELRIREEEIKQNYQKLYQNIENGLKLELENYKYFIKGKIIDSLETILEVLSLDKNNLPLVKQEIEEVLENFTYYKPIKIKVNPNLVEILPFNEIKVESSENLSNLDFEIEFENFKVEKHYKELLQQVIDEIRREIKTD